MEKSIKILKIYKNTFRVNVYTVKPFRAIGLIDADIQYNYGIERVRLAFYRSSGTNGGKIMGLWYPLVGIKVNMGQFTEFSNMVNKIMEISTRSNNIMVGWLAKSVFFSNKVNQEYQQRGFSYGTHYNDLLEIGKGLSVLYNRNEYIYDNSLTSVMYNHLLYSREIFKGNKYNQEINFSNFIEDIFLQK